MPLALATAPRSSVAGIPVKLTTPESGVYVAAEPGGKLAITTLASRGANVSE